MIEDVLRAYRAIAEKQARVARYFDYYDGEAEAPLVSKRLKDVYQDELNDLSENWAATVVDAVADRIALQKLEGPDAGASQTLADITEATELLLEADEVHRHALIAREGFLIVWPSPETDELEVYAQHPAACTAFYDPNAPNYMQFAAKTYDADGLRHLVLYYRDVIEEWASTAPLNSSLEVYTQSRSWQLVSSAENPYDVIPVFHFRPERRRYRSELDNVIPLQDAVNILVTNMLVTSEFGAAPMKWVITNADLPKRLRIAPNEIWEIPAGDDGEQPTSVGQFGAANLENFLGVIDHFITSIAIISRTPRHYFYRQGGDPSGEALRVMEAPLVKKAERYIARFASTWKQVGAFLLLLAKTQAPARSIVVTFDDPETTQPLHDALTEKAKADATIAEQEAGMSRRYTLKQNYHFTDKEVDEMQTERATERASLGESLLAQFDRGKVDE
jgi:hypothetical protein